MTASALARVFPTMTGLMLWITSFNLCRASLLLLLSNVFLKVRVVYLKANSTILGAFQCSACLVGAPPTCTSSTINFSKDALSGLRQFLATENPLKVMKNAFCFNSKALFFSRYLSFCHYFLFMYRNGLIKKIRLILNFMMSLPG